MAETQSMVIDGVPSIIRPPQKRGRKLGTGFWDQIGLPKLVELAELGQTQEQIARAAGKRSSSLYNWMHTDYENRAIPLYAALIRGAAQFSQDAVASIDRKIAEEKAFQEKMRKHDA